MATIRTRFIGKVEGCLIGFNQYRRDWIEHNGEWFQETVFLGVKHAPDIYDDGHNLFTRPSRDTRPYEVEGFDGEETLTDTGAAVYDSDEYETADEYPSDIDGDVLLYGEANEMRGPWNEIT